MHSVAENTAANLSFVILHTSNLSESAKAKFLKLTAELNSSINFFEINMNDGNFAFTDWRKFPERIFAFFRDNLALNGNEKVIYMLSPKILDKDISDILKENYLEDKSGIIPMFEKQSKEGLDFGEEASENFLENFAKTPFMDGAALKRIIAQFEAKEREKVYSLRAVYNAMLKAKHRVFFTTEKRYNDYIKNYLFNEETDKIFFIEGNEFKIDELKNSFEIENTFMVLFTEHYNEMRTVLEDLNKIESVDFTDGRVILTENEGGFPKTDLNLIFRDV